MGLIAMRKKEDGRKRYRKQCIRGGSFMPEFKIKD